MEDQHLHADFNEGRGISPGKSWLDVEVLTDQDYVLNDGEL
jgi:hypothetical protein